MQLPRIMGHRGAALLAPENTLPGLAAARAAGCDWVEFDVMLSADAVPIVHHDLELGRCENGTGAVDALTFAELSRFDAGAHFAPAYAGTRIPSLADWLRAMQGMSPNVEIKPAPGREVETTRAALQVLADHRAAIGPGWDGRRLLISSFDRTSLEAARALQPDWPLGLIADRLPADWRDYAARLGLYSLHLNARYLTKEEAGAVKAAGLFLAVYTVNDPELARACWALGVDCVITDAPDRLREFPGER